MCGKCSIKVYECCYDYIKIVDEYWQYQAAKKSGYQKTGSHSDIVTNIVKIAS
jgi:hypothetical protein